MYGVKEGFGSYNSGDGDSYEGGFKRNCYSGKGIARYGNGDVYDGEWLAGR